MTLFKTLFLIILFIAVSGIEVRAQSFTANNPSLGRNPNDSFCTYAEGRIRVLEKEDSLLVELGEIDKVTYAAKGNKLYTRRKWNDEWVFFTTLPFYTDSTWGCGIYNKAVAYRVTYDSIGLYHPGNGIITYTTVSAILDGFLKEGISQVCVDVTVNIAKTGCDTMYEPKSCYRKQGDVFRLVSGEIKKPMVMNVAELDSLVAAIPRTFDRNSFLDSVNFTREDYEKCKQEIIHVIDSVKGKRALMSGIFDIAPGEYVDLDKLLAMVDSVKTINRDSLFYDVLFWGVSGGRWGYFAMDFTSRQGQVVSVHYTGTPWGALYNKWYVSINSLSWWSTIGSPFMPYFRAHNSDLFSSLASARERLLRYLVVRCYYYYCK